MKTFLSYLREDLLKKKDVAWQTSVFELVFSESTTRLPDWIPVTTKTTEAIFGQTHKINTVHVTDRDGLKGLLSIVGTKKTISSTTTVNYDSVLTGSGIHRGGIIACITGDFVLGYDQDLMTIPDNNGRRWINMHYLGDHVIRKNREQVSTFLRRCQTLKKDIMNRYEKPLKFDTKTRIDYSNKKQIDMPIHSDLYKNDPDDRDELPLYHESVWMNFGLTCKAHTDNKILGSVIKDYVDGMNKLVLVYKSLFFDLLSSHKNDVLDGYYNEILINNIQIKGVFCETDTYPVVSIKKMVGTKFPVIEFDSVSKEDMNHRKTFLRRFVDSGVFDYAVQ